MSKELFSALPGSWEEIRYCDELGLAAIHIFTGLRGLCVVRAFA